MKVALDTNILAYAEGTSGVEMRDKAIDLIQGLPAGSVVLPAAAARTAMLTWRDAYPLSDTSSTVMINAADLASDHQLGIWDSVIIAATAEAGRRLLLSEDLQEGFTWRGVTVTNPFARPHHALLDVLLNERNI